MHQTRHIKFMTGLAFLAAFPVISLQAFEGYIEASSSRGGPPISMLYTVGTNCIRVEILDTNAPNAINLVDRSSGQVTLIFPNNRSFMRLTSGAEVTPQPGMHGGMRPGMDPNAPDAPGAPGMLAPPRMPGAPQMPGPPGGMPPGIGPTNVPGMPGARPGMPQMPQMPQRPQMPPMPQSSGMSGGGGMPAMPMMEENLELQATGATTNLLGYECQGFQIKERAETMTIWATDQLLPFQIYMAREPHRFGPPKFEEQWGKAVTDKKLFPLLASLQGPNGMERYRFEVESIKPVMLGTNEYSRLAPPAGYIQLHPHPF
jgi:Domain of unknown function (DUF4412)